MLIWCDLRGFSFSWVKIEFCVLFKRHLSEWWASSFIKAVEWSTHVYRFPFQSPLKSNKKQLNKLFLIVIGILTQFIVALQTVCQTKWGTILIKYDRIMEIRLTETERINPERSIYTEKHIKNYPKTLIVSNLFW